MDLCFFSGEINVIFEDVKRNPELNRSGKTINRIIMALSNSSVNPAEKYPVLQKLRIKKN